MNLPPSLIMGSIPVVLAIASTLIAWRYVQNRMLFFVVAVLTPGGSIDSSASWAVFTRLF